jgi:hypothetical protein
MSQREVINMPNHIAFCIPMTSNNRDWNTFDDCYLNQILLPSINVIKYCPVLYIGYDIDDKVFGDRQNRPKRFQNYHLNWYSFDENYKGNPCAIWSKLCDYAIMDGIEYLFLCGDDISLDQNPNWLDIFIKKLQDNKNIGYSAPWSNNDQIPTQFLIHKTHIDIFHWAYPPQIHNFFCDNHMAELYGKKYGNWLKEFRHLNLGGEPRYTPLNDRNLCTILVRKNKKILNRYLDKNKLRK